VLVRGDDLAVQDRMNRECLQLGQQSGHVPAAPATDGEVAVASDDRPEAVPIDLKGVTVAEG
jgi:hypothetical protein